MSSSTTPVQLFLLGRTLMKIGEESLPELPQGADTHRVGTRAALVVLSDLLGHPDTSVSAIAVRTGLPQSQVSGAVARLKDAGSIVTAPDPADGRRQLIRRAPKRRSGCRRSGRPGSTTRWPPHSARTTPSGCARSRRPSTCSPGISPPRRRAACGREADREAVAGGTWT